METVVEGKNSRVIISKTAPTVIIGERLNPTGKKRLTAALKEKDFNFIIREAIRQKTGKVNFDTARRVSEELGLNIVVGASNVSHGLPDRKVINTASFALGTACGMTAYIADPTVIEITQTILAADLLLGKDEWAENYISFYRKKEASKNAAA